MAIFACSYAQRSEGFRSQSHINVSSQMILNTEMFVSILDPSQSVRRKGLLLLSRLLPNNSFKPRPLRGSAAW